MSREKTPVETYREKLLMALRMRDVPGERIGEVLAEVEAHVAETGEHPEEAFGGPRAYADEVVAATGRRGGRWRMTPGTALSSAFIGVASFFAATWLIGGASKLLSGEQGGRFGLSVTGELGIGVMAAAVVVAVLVHVSVKRQDPVRDPRTGALSGRISPWVLTAVAVTVVVVVAGLATALDVLI